MTGQDKWLAIGTAEPLSQKETLNIAMSIVHCRRLYEVFKSMTLPTYNSLPAHDSYIKPLYQPLYIFLYNLTFSYYNRYPIPFPNRYLLKL